MINVIATVQLKPGTRDEFLKIFRANVPNVHAEDGCIEYVPTIDVATGLAPQSLDENVVTVVEKWASVDALQKHVAAPHMVTYKEQTQAMVASLSLKITEEA